MKDHTTTDTPPNEPAVVGPVVERAVRPAAVPKVIVDGVQYTPATDEPRPLHGTWQRTATRKPRKGEDVLCFWRASYAEAPTVGVATYMGDHWHDPEDDEDTYREPEFWMRLPAWPDEQA